MIPVERKTLRIKPDAKRVIARYFNPGNGQRVNPIMERILKMPTEEVSTQIKNIIAQYSGRHRNINKIILRNFEKALVDGDIVSLADTFSDQQKMLLGAYFTMEYSIESAAIFNPSIVEAPDQNGVASGEKKVIISFRAVGEGHISSLVFREGILDKKNNLKLVTNQSNIVDMPEKIKRHVYEKAQFIKKMQEMDLPEKICELAAQKLKDNFGYGELRDCLEKCAASTLLNEEEKKRLPHVSWLAKAHYEVYFSQETTLAERVIFPISYRETNGIEDVRLVRFVEDSGEVTYYGTYTAYNGSSILPKIIETKDFYTFKMSPANGQNMQNKGLAFFPRKVKGRYAMLARLDGVNNYIMYSNDMYVWPNQAIMLEAPEYPWEFIQIGNCGSPIETSAGWLVITHGVGPMRQYCLGATLLDLENPEKVIGRLKEPFLVANEEEREGYVPNVVYSCGSMLHGDSLIVPYGISDTASSYATVSLKKILEELTRT